jgi:hypothetical protein
MRIRITRLPPTPIMDGCDVTGLQVGRVYDLSAAIAEYLVVAGYAVPEMRAVDRAHDGSKAPTSPRSSKHRQ